MIITSKSNPIVKKYASLKEKKYRREHGLFFAEGFKMVREALSSPLKTECVVVSEDYTGDTYGSQPTVVSSAVFEYLSDEKTPQGIMAVLEIPKRALKAPRESCLLLDGIADPANMGAIIRTANAAGYKEIYLADCTDPYSPKSVRSAMSGLFFTTLYMGEREELLRTIEGAPILSADMDGENIFTFSVPEKFVLAIGNEANGISEEVLKRSSYKIKIPMDQTAESLNAGVSAGIAMYLLKANQFKNI